MKHKELLEKVATLVGFKFSSLSYGFAEAELEGGIRITNSTEGDFVVGDTISLVNEDGTYTIVGAGEHKLLDGRVFITDTEGVLTEIKDITSEEPGDETQVVEEMEEVEVEVPENVADVMSPDVVEAVVEALTPIVEELKVLTEEMKKLKKDYEKFKSEASHTPLKEDKIVSKNFSDARYEILKQMKQGKK